MYYLRRYEDPLENFFIGDTNMFVFKIDEINSKYRMLDNLLQLL